MAKRIILISSFPLFAAIAIIAIVLAGIGHGQPASIPVETGNFDDANAAVDKLIADYNDNARLASTLVGTAGQYAWDRKYDSARRLYGAVIDNHPDNPFTTKARLGLARVEVLGLIGEKDFSVAQEKLDSMIADFNDEPDLPVAIFHIGKEFTWQHRYSEAKDTFAYLIDKPLADSFSREIRLWSARANICSLIGKAKDDEIVAATDKLMSDFSGDAGLAEAVYWISKEYEWKKGTTINRIGWYDTPNSVYQKIMQEFGDTPYGKEAQWDQKRLAHRMKIFKLISEPNQAATEAAVEAMATDLKGRPELASELYWVACGYEEHPNKLQQAKQIYERIVKDCPGTEEADRAALDVRRRILCNVLDSGDVNSAYTLVDEFIADFKQNPYAGDCLGRIVIGCYKRAAELTTQKQTEKTNQYREVSANIWERMQKDNLQIVTDLAYLYFYVGANYLELKRWDAAIENFQKLLDDWPDFEYACTVQAAIGGSYEVLRDEGGVPKEAVNPLIEQAYKAILANYPGCYETKEVSFRLAGMMLDKGDKAGAIKYYQKFLELSDPNADPTRKFRCAKSKSLPQDSRIEAAKAKLAELAAEGGTN
jgi:tetratricopeptide (TPR) repeat protein